MSLAKILAIGTFSFFASLPAVAQQPDGQALYQKNCAQCHGEDLRGGNAQSMIDKVWQFGGDRGEIFQNIKHGITHLGMPAYENALSDVEMRAIVAFITEAEEASGATKPEPPERVQSLDYEIEVEVFADGLEIPWAIAFPDEHTALITERPGRLRVVRDGALDPNAVSGTPEVLHEGQGGLMEVAIDPNYAENGWIYLAYSHALEKAADEERPRAMTRIVRGHVRDDAWVDEQVVYEAPPESYLSTRHHYGCRIVFDKAGHLYFSIGERGHQDHAQDLSRPNGKIHRIWPDGSVPDDNPFVGKAGALATIFSYGNRNAQGLAIHPESGLLWESEHGPMGGDELNVIRAGRNYGWPLITYGRNYNGVLVSEFERKPGLEQPAFYYRPSLALCGIDFYRGEQFPKWQNALLVTALRYEEVRVVQVEQDRVLHEETILKNVGRIRAANPGPDGAVYVVANDPGRVFRLSKIKDRQY